MFLLTQGNRQTAQESKEGGKGNVAIVRIVKQLGCASQDAEPPKFKSIFRMGTNSLRLKRRVRFTSQAPKKRERKPSRGVIQATYAPGRSFLAPKFEDRTQEDTLAKERWARREAWDLAKKLYKLEGDLDANRATFFFPSEVWCLPAPSSSKPEEKRVRRGFRCLHAHV